MDKETKATNNTKAGCGCVSWFTVILTTVFVIAKIMGLIDWSWWLVFMPVLLYAAAFIGLMAVYGIVVLIAIGLEE